VTEVDSDAAMVNALAKNGRMTEAYAQLLEQDADFQDRLVAFAELWPVLNVRDVRKKLGRDAFWQMDRDELMQACQQAEVKSQPIGWRLGDLPTWPQLLRTIYLVRCNLFHGAKIPPEWS
jgi:hypothetical protein